MNITYTKTGAMHLEGGIPCQDVVYAGENTRYKIIVLADGVSACENSHIGAAVACQAAADYLLEFGASLSQCDDQKIACLVLEQVVFALEEKAAELGVRPESMSSTLSFCWISKSDRSCIVFHLGDGGVYLLEEQRAEPLTRSCGSRTVSTMTRGASRAVRMRRMDLPGQAQVLLCSDGVSRAMADPDLGSRLHSAMLCRDFGGMMRLLDQAHTPDDCCFIVI